jgi:surface antigen
MHLSARAIMASVLLSIATLSAAPANAQGWQCAPFARVFSGIQLFGDAYSWWQKAVGKYAQGAAPKEGAVLVFKAFGSMRVGHVATVTQVVSDRIIKVTHANWSRINGHKGQVERDVTVVDTSAKGDWSAVKVWFDPIKAVGTRAYPTYGFIYGKGEKPAEVADVAVAADEADVAPTL